MSDTQQESVVPEPTIGVSAGSEVVCCAVLTTARDGTETFDYRTVTAEGARSDIGDLVATSLDLASHHLVDEVTGPATSGGRIAVAHRGGAGSRSILSATRRHHVTSEHLVTDTDALLCWLRHTGEVARYGHVLLVDVGASGTTTTVIDQVDGTVRAVRRTDEVSGAVLDAHLLALTAERLPAVTTSDRPVVAARLRTAKEQLSFHESVTVDLPGAETLTVTRAEMVVAIAAPLAALRELVLEVLDEAGPTARPEVTAVVGGGAHVPAVVETITDAAGVPAVPTPEPDAAVAKGAALLARDLGHSVLPASVRPPTSIAGSLRTVGLLAAACAAMAVVLAYGVQALTPSSEPSVTTVATSELPESATAEETATSATAPDAAPPALTGGWDGEPAQPTAVEPWPTTDYTYTPEVRPYPSRSTAPTATATMAPPTSTTPTLRPAPDLPVIVLPDIPGLPPWWTDLTSVLPTPPVTTPESAPESGSAPVSPAPGAVVPESVIPEGLVPVPTTPAPAVTPSTAPPA
ncbi:Hsp70 family protein [Rhodococcus sp. BP-349]|uniref:Hsp70 family protein n=1 Tax=unclassified Rhodococcus (in: high G+C Gram-positive bacteria) TaxID=192944 RepID=UPI001C9AAB84|nr:MULTISPECIES: Hsp70 family protein [unclassified Rhodococcus (in: high G+C Gram-positive bacteria)]MBY6538739.1 Hsp70 family protein [Rhodococcus sp. BP-363]MBY6543076.1 Hsp70 family protein [Rhodococcus sp. BP-369]MBY6562306.1 Hsp70 family protein [Rhodococcus sp. BP-370]MBY6576598.1 Hsp70 family protein [Rhodococcus sp. BP-364]MBY6585899.1 Hsp70 family protein [Rhodococcus sp. BP-358]